MSYLLLLTPLFILCMTEDRFCFIWKSQIPMNPPPPNKYFILWSESSSKLLLFFNQVTIYYLVTIKVKLILSYRGSTLCHDGLYIYPTPSSWAGYDTGSIFNRNTACFNSVFFLIDWFPYQSWRTQFALLFTLSWKENRLIPALP